MYIILGLIIITQTLTHFEYAKDYCNSVVVARDEFQANNSMYIFTDEIQDLLNDNSELFLWDKCQFKVYPINLNNHHNKDICQCRSFIFQNATCGN